MIRSMTAFARQQTHGENGEITWEIRSVRERVTARLGRGKVECNLRLKTGGAGNVELRINQPLVEQILAASEKMAHRLHSSHHPSIMDLLRWPGVIEAGEQDLTPV